MLWQQSITKSFFEVAFLRVEGQRLGNHGTHHTFMVVAMV